MKKLHFLLLILTLLILPDLAHSRAIISGISSNSIDIDTSFTGEEVLLFGAKGNAGGIVIAIKGPKRSYMVNQKEKVLGIWYSSKRVKFDDVYSYYGVFSTVPLQELSNNNLLNKLELGSENVKFVQAYKNHDDINVLHFREQLVQNLVEKDLYRANLEKIEFLNETLFKATLVFPEKISQGVYTIEIYLVENGNLVAFQSIPITVKKVGFSAFVTKSANENQILYGLISIFIAIFIGWIVNMIFVRFNANK